MDCEDERKMPSEHEEIDFGDADAGNGGFDVDADAPPDAHEDDGAERDFSAEDEGRQREVRLLLRQL